MKLFQRQVSYVFSKCCLIVIIFSNTLANIVSRVTNLYSIVSVIEVAFSGKAFVQWTEGGGENSTTYTEKQKFFKHKAPVTGSIVLDFDLSVFFDFWNRCEIPVLLRNALFFLENLSSTFQQPFPVPPSSTCMKVNKALQLQ